MKIISGARQVHCDKCGCIYEFDAEDVIKWVGVPHVLCPICGNKHNLVDPGDYY
jgi:hypothetical protein